MHGLIEPQPTNLGLDTEQYQGDGDSGRREGTVYGCAGYLDEVPVQGYGPTRLGGRERECASGLAREGEPLRCCVVALNP